MTMLHGLDQQRGISLLEVMLSFSVIGLVLAVALHLWPQASRHQKITATVQQVVMAKAAVEHWQAMPGTKPSALSVQHLIDMGLLDAHDALSPWGQAWQLSTVGQSGGYKVTFDGMTPEVCRHVAALLSQQLHVVGGCVQGRYEGVFTMEGGR